MEVICGRARQASQFHESRVTLRMLSPTPMGGETNGHGDVLRLDTIRRSVHALRLNGATPMASSNPVATLVPPLLLDGAERSSSISPNTTTIGEQQKRCLHQVAVMRCPLADTVLAGAIKSERLEALDRSLQLFDSISLYLGLNDCCEVLLLDIPRNCWTDCCTIH